MSRSHRIRSSVAAAALALSLFALAAPRLAAEPLAIDWEKNWLYIRSPRLPGGEVRVHYLEAFCRGGSTDADWVKHTVIPHKTVRVEGRGPALHLASHLEDGVMVQHTITPGEDEVTFELLAENPTDRASEAQWAQPCVRLDKFTGCTQETYVPKCFVFLDGKLARLPTDPWATAARYVPGQVYCPRGVNRDDVNPRPLSPLVPSNGLTGCFSGDERTVFATAWEPYQELFQGVAVCMHSDFHIGGLEPHETKKIRGKIYIVPANIDVLLQRYERDFPEQK